MQGLAHMGVGHLTGFGNRELDEDLAFHAIRLGGFGIDDLSGDELHDFRGTAGKFSRHHFGGGVQGVFGGGFGFAIGTRGQQHDAHGPERQGGQDTCESNHGRKLVESRRLGMPSSSWTTDAASTVCPPSKVCR